MQFVIHQACLWLSLICLEAFIFEYFKYDEVSNLATIAVVMPFAAMICSVCRMAFERIAGSPFLNGFCCFASKKIKLFVK